MSKLDRIRDTYLNQPISEFLEHDGSVREYAELVFSGQVFGPGQDVTDAELGIETVDDLVSALQELVQEERDRVEAARAARLAALEAHRESTQFQPLDDASPTVRVLLNLPESLRAELDVVAQKRNLSRSAAIREAITAWTETAVN